MKAGVTLGFCAVLSLGTALFTIDGRAGAQTTAPAGSAGNAVRGRADFLSYGCYECHGTVGQGNYMSAPSIAPHPIPYAAINAYIRRPSGQMPSYATSILPDKDVADIYAYLTSLPAAKPVSAIPVLSSIPTKPK